MTVNIPTTGTYYLWGRLLAPDTTNNSYYLQIDGGCAYNVGDSAGIPANTWTWVNYQNGTNGSVISVNLTAGAHQVVMTGREANVGVDRLLFLADSSCVPVANGDNCTPAASLPTPVKGDVTGPSGTPDGKIDIQDVSYLIRNYNTTNATADVTGPSGTPDGKVDIYDLSYEIRNYGQ